jgi:carbonyl reductase 1
LANHGLKVIATARTLEKAQAAASEIDGAVEPLELDVTSESSIAQALERVRDRHIDVLVNNAAIALRGFDASVVRRTLDSNFYGVMRVTDALLPSCGSPGVIVMVSSGAGTLSHVSPDLASRFASETLTREQLIELVESFHGAVEAGRHQQLGWPSSAYSVSKVALNALTRWYARTLIARGIHVNAVCPGWVRTDMGGPNADRSLEEGASGIVAMALIDEHGPSGGFYRDGKPIDW